MQRMDRLRRSLRESFRRKKEVSESSKPHQWQADEDAVKAGNCTFHVKYLGCVEVFESRGMQVCEEAMKVLRASRRRPVKSNLYVSGDGLRVVEDDTKGLIVDQTIEKVSFCAPDRNHERGFSYICRDGTTRRWMCHGFLATKDSGERLSHAVGCAFAVCLERKQKREKECGVTMTYDNKTSTFTRSGSFRVSSMTESLTKSTSGHSIESANHAAATPKPPPVSTHAIERPHAPPKMLERQGSFRGFSQLSNHSPFKRQLSLRLNELPSNLQRTQQNAMNIFGAAQATNIPPPVSSSPAPPPRTQRNRLQSLPSTSVAGGTIPEVSSTNTSEIHGGTMKIENTDPVSELCQQVTQGLSLLAANHDENKFNGVVTSPNKFGRKFTNPWDEEVGNTNSALPILNTAPLATSNSIISSSKPGTQSTKSKATDSWLNNFTQNHEPKALQPKISPIKENIPVKSPSKPKTTASVAPNSNNLSTGRSLFDDNTPSNNIAQGHTKPLNKPQNLPGSSQMNSITHRPGHRGMPPRSQSLGADPFDADWAAPLARTGQTPTNPFSRQQTFQVSM